MNDREPRVDQFLLDAQEASLFRVRVPDPAEDCGMYAAMDMAFEGIHKKLETWRRNYGRLGYGTQNEVSDLTKAYIDAILLDDEQEAAYIDLEMKKLLDGFEDAVLGGALPADADRFSRTAWQESMEMELFGRIWPVIVGRSSQVPELTTWNDFGTDYLQAYLYGYLDVVSELGKAVTEELYRRNKKRNITSVEEFDLFERYLTIADSITLRLSQERHAPGYVISNGYGRWVAYSTKLRTAYGTIAHVKRDYNSRCSNQRMINESTSVVVRQVLAELHLAENA